MPLSPRALNTFKRLGRIAPAQLEDARLQLHYAAQIVGAIGHTLLEPADDHGHLSLQWIPKRRMLASGQVAGETPFRAALRPEDAVLCLLDADGMPAHYCALDGRTLDEGFAWLEATIARHTGGAISGPLQRADHEMPDHRVAEGAAFDLSNRAAFAELSRWYANADALLRPIQLGEEGAAPVRCWPHHFDIATLITLDPDQDAEEARSINVGLSPGDGSYAEPYWYVTPWPAPEADDLPALASQGRWHTDGWVGMVLPAGTLLRATTAKAQATQSAAFLDAGVAAAYGLLSPASTR